MELEQQFEEALTRVGAMPTQPPNIQLALYGLFKQATQGDVIGKRPGMMEMRARAKYDAWAEHKGTGALDAKQAYVNKVNELKG